MPPFDFPNSPTLGQTVSNGGVSYQWDGVKWVAVGGGGGGGGAFLPLTGGTLSGDLTVNGRCELHGGVDFFDAANTRTGFFNNANGTMAALYGEYYPGEGIGATITFDGAAGNVWINGLTELHGVDFLNAANIRTGFFNNANGTMASLQGEYYPAEGMAATITLNGATGDVNIYGRSELRAVDFFDPAGIRTGFFNNAVGMMASLQGEYYPAEGMAATIIFDGATGQAWKPGGAMWSDSSDRRLKRNIGPLQRGLAEILQLQPKTWQWNGLAGTPQDNVTYAGLVADEVQQVVPEVVGRRRGRLQARDAAETEILTTNSTLIFYAMINAIKELASRVEALEKAVGG